MRHRGRISVTAAAAIAIAVVVAVLSTVTAGIVAGVLAVLAGLIAPLVLQAAIDGFRRERAQRRELARAREQLSPPAADLTSPAGYLRAEAKVVPFRDRPELEVLRGWLASGRPADARLVTGPGGAGKTRLALRLRQEAQERGWHCYWIRKDGEAQAADAARLDPAPALFIVDYAETCAGLAGVLKAALVTSAARRRVLLLARSTGEWWEQLAASSNPPLSDVIAAVPVIALGTLTSAGRQDEVFAEALKAFADKLEVPCPADAALPPVGPDAVALVIHAAALLAVLDRKVPGVTTGQAVSADDVIERLLQHEARYWQQSQASYQLNLQPAVLSRAVTAGTLVGADDEESAARMLAAIRDLGPESRGNTARWLHHLYPGPGGGRDWIAPLQPDLLAEHLVTSTLKDLPALRRDLLTGLPPHRASRALTILARAALTYPAATGIIGQALAADPEHLAVPALAVAIETNRALGDLLADAAASGTWPADLLRRVASELPDTSVALAPVGAAVYQRLLAESESGDQERARRMVSLSNWLGALGRREEALDASTEAVTIRRELAAARPDAFRPDLATSLNNQANRLSDLGRREEALDASTEAVTTRRELAAALPQVFAARLASSLSVMAGILEAMGRKAEAAKAEAAKLI